jgi:hypothetical protein
MQVTEFCNASQALHHSFTQQFSITEQPCDTGQPQVSNETVLQVLIQKVKRILQLNHL